MKLLQHILLKWLVFAGLVIGGVVPSSLHSQVVVAIGDNIGCYHNEVLIPISFEKFEDVAAITLYIQIDTSNISYQGIENINSAFSTGDLIGSFSPQNQVITLTWVSLSPVSLSNGQICELRLQLKADEANLDLLDGSELANSSLSVITDVTYLDGLVVNLQNFDELEPMSQTLQPGSQATIEVLDVPNMVSCQWQVLEGDDWVNIQDEVSYQGIYSPVLIIPLVTEKMNGDLYRCLLSVGNCQVASLSSELVVTPSGLEENVINPVLILSPNPANDQFNCIINVAIPDMEIRLNDLFGKTRLKYLTREFLPNQHLQFGLEDLEGGIYIIQLISRGKLITSTKLIHY